MVGSSGVGSGRTRSIPEPTGSDSGGEAGGHKFKIGQQTVQFSPRGQGLYVVTLLLPQRDGEFEYCISSEAEPYDRVAKESELRYEFVGDAVGLGCKSAARGATLAATRRWFVKHHHRTKILKKRIPNL